MGSLSVVPWDSGVNHQPSPYHGNSSANERPRRSVLSIRTRKRVRYLNPRSPSGPPLTPISHTTDQLGPDGDEYIPRVHDEAGEKKLTLTGQLLAGRNYRCRTFSVLNRGEKLYMLATECAKVLDCGASYHLFTKYKSLYRIIVSRAEKEDLIRKEILAPSDILGRIEIVTARSMFRQFGSRLIVNGRPKRDDYWEGSTPNTTETVPSLDLAGKRRGAGTGKARRAGVPAAEAETAVAPVGLLNRDDFWIHFNNPWISPIREGLNTELATVSGDPDSHSLAETLSPNTVSEQDSIASISDDETEYSADESNDGICHSNSSDVDQLRRCSDVMMPILSLGKRNLVDHVMDAFWEIFCADITWFGDDTGQKIGQSLAAETSDTSGSSRNTSTSSISPRSNLNTSQGSSSTNGKGKAKKRNNNEDDGENDDRERDSKRPRQLQSTPVASEERSKFACPYRKNNPGKYRSTNRQWRSCALTPLENIARVKGHLYRHHMIYPCQRCKEIFKTQEEVGLHLNEVKGCELRDIGLPDGITNEIVERLKCKKKMHRNETEEDKWRNMYRLLFPGAVVRSPYFEQPGDSTQLEEYEEYCRRELPRVVRATLEDIVNRETQPMEDQLIGQLENIIRNAQHQVYASYRSISNPENADRGSIHPLESTREDSAGLQLNIPATEELAASMPLDTPFQSHLELSQQQNYRDTSTSDLRLHSASSYERNSSTYLSQPRASIEQPELEEHGQQATASEARQSWGESFQEVNSRRTSYSHNGQDWSFVSEFPSNQERIPDPHDFDAVDWNDFEQEQLDDFDWDTFGS